MLYYKFYRSNDSIKDMTLLKVHDHQQDLSHDFLKMVRSTLQQEGTATEKRQLIFLQGQEMGFCNDDIMILLEDLAVE